MKEIIILLGGFISGLIQGASLSATDSGKTDYAVCYQILSLLILVLDISLIIK